MRHENYMAALIRRKTLFCRVRYPVGVPVGIADPPPGGRRLPECGGLNLELVDGLDALPYRNRFFRAAEKCLNADFISWGE